MGEPARKQDVVVRLKPARPARQERERSERRIRGHVTGVLMGRDPQGRPLVDYPGNPHGRLVARTTVSLDAAGAAFASAAQAPGREVLLVFEGERSDRPVIVGVLQPAGKEASPPRGPPVVGGAGIEAKVDGRRVVVDAQDEIVLSCGEASITLRRNGRVVIRGAYVETRSRGVNRVKGGSVQIN